MQLSNLLLWQVLPSQQTLPISKMSRPIQPESLSEATPSFSDSSGLSGATRPCMVRSGFAFTCHTACMTPCCLADPAADANTSGGPSDDQARLLQTSQQAATSGAAVTRSSLEDTRSALEILPDSAASFCMPAENACSSVVVAGLQTAATPRPSRRRAHAHTSHGSSSHAHISRHCRFCHIAGPAQLALQPAASPVASRSLSGSGGRHSPGRQTRAQMPVNGLRQAEAGWIRERLACQQLPCWSEAAQSR